MNSDYVHNYRNGRTFQVWVNIVIIEPQNHISGQGPQEVFSPTFCSNKGQLWGQARLLRVLPNWIYKTSRDGY